MPGHLGGEQRDARHGDDRHLADEVAAPPEERRMVGVEGGERQVERERGGTLRRHDEAGEQQRANALVAFGPSPNRPLTRMASIAAPSSELQRERLVDQHALDAEIERQPPVELLVAGDR